ncbi:n-alkane-inducible cytochrome P450 [Aspergillus costaricaensis CBS 115574]|uniref:N-alkane-inducible cytochrome P450 n=1 Tax=Aspergillus costaricaensis CBS 115574 TaxID=1448317 RepID=A0ACD1IJ76_9EURO|nr:n-alkane-inducible cytochrome P450 [Aspergillus costaricaensis CBS 115574]RAK90360.1 n-alkane-inducible cytochrome P450 [Aspergillus costaricaensis CBS 115574]
MAFLSSSAAILIVGTLICALAYRFITLQRELRANNQIAAANGCLPLRQWNSAWPLGLDLLVQAFRHDRRQQILQFFLDIVAESGTTFEQNLLFSRGVDTSDPQNIQALLSTQFADFGLGLRPPTFYPLLGSGIFTQDGAHWQHSRELLRPQFMKNRIANFKQICSAVDNLISGIPNENAVDLQPLFFRLTFETTLFLLFGQYLSSLQSEGITDQESDFANAFNLGQEYLAKRGRLGNFYWLLGGRTFRKACKTCHEFVDRAVQEALGSATNKIPGIKREPYIFIDALIEETRNLDVLRDQCLNILLAGRDTTACCLTWTLRLLVQHPHVLFKLRAEISDTVGIGLRSPTPTITQVKSLAYLSLVIKEVLRLYPSVPINSRAATKTTTLPTGGGPAGTAPILVRKGEAVGYCVYAMHRRRDIYGADADEFRPERWENDALKDVGWGYLPFNGGPRVCLGQEFALLEVGYTIVRLLQTFEAIEQAEGYRMEKRVGEERQVLTLVLSCGEGCVVKMRRYGDEV